MQRETPCIPTHQPQVERVATTRAPCSPKPAADGRYMLFSWLSWASIVMTLANTPFIAYNIYYIPCILQYGLFYLVREEPTPANNIHGFQPVEATAIYLNAGTIFCFMYFTAEQVLLVYTSQRTCYLVFMCSEIKENLSKLSQTVKDNFAFPCVRPSSAFGAIKSTYSILCILL